MPIRNIVTGQSVISSMLERAHQLRREMTPAERILWKARRRDQLAGYHFRRQQIIAGYIVDFYCHQAELVIEVDGDIHLQQREYDAEPDQVLAALGLRVLHFPNGAVEHHLPDVFEKIRVACS